MTGSQQSRPDHAGCNSVVWDLDTDGEMGGGRRGEGERGRGGRGGRVRGRVRV